MSARVSFVIATRDEDPEILHATIAGIQRTSPGYWREIILVDDGSREPVSLLSPPLSFELREHKFPTE